MKLDSSSSHSIADEIKRFPFSRRGACSTSKPVSVPDSVTGAEVETCTDVMQQKQVREAETSASWCYLFVHHKKVRGFETQLEKDHRPFFIHTTIKCAPKKGRGIREVAVPTVSGLIFLKGHPVEIQHYLDEKFAHHRLCKNCSTGRVAEIPNSQMAAFMSVARTDPDRIRFLLRPFHYYAKNRSLLRIVSGPLAGIEGYVIRIARDRRLVMDVGGMSVAISGVHIERFEEVGKNEADRHERATFYRRNLHERNAFIDRYFHPIREVGDIAAQAENIELLHEQTLSDLREDRLEVKDAYDTFYFIIEEIGYYYAPAIDTYSEHLAPILDAGRAVLQEIPRLLATLPPTDDLRQRCEAEYEQLQTNYGYLFE